MKRKYWLLVYSYHHKNTEKIAKVLGKILNAKIKKPQEIKPEILQEYYLIGFGSGIYSAKNHESLLDLAENLPNLSNKQGFIFSTAGISSEKKMHKDHARLRTILNSKGFIIDDEFQCKGFNTNSFLRFFGGINKKRPNSDDIRNAEQFALKIKRDFLKN